MIPLWDSSQNLFLLIFIIIW